jgi:hypothetical protein
MSPALATAWENVSFTTVATGYQRVNILPSETRNPTFGGGMVMESGIMQVSLCYPVGNGSATAAARAELLRAWFYRGLSLTSGAVTVIIGKTPSIAPAQFEPGLYVIPVSIHFYSYV